MKTEDAAKAAVDTLKGKEVNGRAITIEIARPQTEPRPKPKAAATRARGGQRTTPSEPSKTNVHVSNISSAVTTEKLKEAFKDFKVTRCTLGGRIVASTGKTYAFVTFENEEEQKRAIEQSGKLMIGGDALIIAAAKA
jgi:RNA recognition motif-containing protein